MKNLPNILTITRLISPIYYLLIIWLVESGYYEKFFILILFSLLSITDYLDGHIARKYNLTSKFGRVFDPLSDKILVIVTLMYLSVLDNNILYPTFLLLMREFLISGLREYSLDSFGKSINVTYLSKIKTALQFLAIIALLSNEILVNNFNFNIYFYAYITLWIATLLTLFTGYQYCTNIIKK